MQIGARTEFEGFVDSFSLNDLLTIECEGYSRLLRLKKRINAYYTTTSAKALLELAVKDTGISLFVQDDIILNNVTIDNKNGEEIISQVERLCGNVITVFFIEPNKLWCGLTYTSFRDGQNPFDLGEAKFRLGYNCLRDSSLKIEQPSEPVQVIIKSTSPAGRRLREMGEKLETDNKKDIFLPNVRHSSSQKAIANEKQNKENYSGFSGFIRAFLQPYTQPGYKIYIREDRYPDKIGYYIADSTEVSFGVDGAFRLVGVGPQIGFK